MVVSTLDLPKTLVNMLSTLADNNELNSWNIFSTRHGVCLNIRFSNAEPGSHSPMPVYYRKQTPRQAKRNLDRAYTHRHGIAAAITEINPNIHKEPVVSTPMKPPAPKKTPLTMILSSTPQSTNIPPLSPLHAPSSPPVTLDSKKRKIDVISPEIVRTQDENTWNTHIDTPELLTHIHNDTSPESFDEPLNDTLDDIIAINNYDCDNMHPPVINLNDCSPLPPVNPSSVSAPPPSPPSPSQPPHQTRPPDHPSPENTIGNIRDNIIVSGKMLELSMLYMRELLRRKDQRGNFT